MRRALPLPLLISALFALVAKQSAWAGETWRDPQAFHVGAQNSAAFREFDFFEEIRVELPVLGEDSLAEFDGAPVSLAAEPGDPTELEFPLTIDLPEVGRIKEFKSELVGLLPWKEGKERKLEVASLEEVDRWKVKFKVRPVPTVVFQAHW
jgi:hypothetical protein